MGEREREKERKREEGRERDGNVKKAKKNEKKISHFFSSLFVPSAHLSTKKKKQERAGAPNHGLPASLSTKPSLAHLDPHGCSLTSLPPAALSSTPRLRGLNLRRNGPTSFPEDLGQRLPLPRGARSDD